MAELNEKTDPETLEELILKAEGLLADDDGESLKAFFSGYSEPEIKGILLGLGFEKRTEALKYIKSDILRELLKDAGDDPATHILWGLPSDLVSDAVETVFKDGSDDAVISLPPFVIQKVLTHGSNSARKVIAASISALVESKRLSQLRGVLVTLNPVDIAEILDDIDRQNLLKLFRLLPKDMASDVFVHITQEKSEQLIADLSEKEAGQIIDDLYADDAADFLEEMPSKVVKKLLAHAKPETRAAINHLLQYSDSTAGSIMTVEFVDLKEDYTVVQAINRIRRDGVDKETIDNCFVLDPERKLLGVVSLRKLLLAAPDQIVADIMDENIIVARTYTENEEVARMFRKYDFTSVPVCDSENRLVGIVTVDDVVDIIQEEALDDASYLNKVTPSDTPYLKTSTYRIWLSRMPWLLVLMVSATFTGLIISKLEAVLVLSTALLAYVPMLMGTGGNAGSQASVSVIRGMVLGEIEGKDAGRVLWKEIRASLLLGLCMAVACFIKVIALDQFIYGVETFDTTIGGVALTGTAAVAAIGGIISIALFCTIAIAKIFGALLPILAKKIKLDPAVVVSPFITTVVDAASLLIYCGFVVAILG